MKVSAIVVTYNRVNILKKCILNILKQRLNVNTIIVINNNSTDETESYLTNLCKHHKNIIVKNLNKNLGGAGGFNRGLKVAYYKTRDNFFWLMDDDSMPTPDALKSLVKSANNLNDNFGFLCSNVRTYQDTPCLPNIPHVALDWTKYLNIGLIKLSYATFVSVLVNRSTVKNFGFPIAQMFIWGDDTEYTTRISRNLESYLVSNSIVNHDAPAKRNKETIFNVSINRIFYYKYGIRNLIYINRKYYSKFKTFKLILRYLHTLCRVPFHTKDHRLLRFYYICYGILRGLTFNPNVERPK